MGILLSLIVSLVLSGNLKGNAEIYPMSTIVTEVNRSTDTVTVEDFNGNLWEFDGAEDWAEGDIAALIMYDNGTSQTVYDDVILTSRYCGYIY